MQPHRRTILLALSTLMGSALIGAIAAPADNAKPAEASARMQQLEAKKAMLAPLERWRVVQDEARLALREPDVALRIQKLEEFLRRNPDHEDLRQVHQTLAESYLETAGFDKARVASLFEKVAESESTYWSGLSLVDRHYLKHALPLDSGERLLALTRTRIEAERGKLDREKDERQRRDRALEFDYYNASTHALLGQLRLVHGDHAGALVALDRSMELLASMPRDLAGIAPDGTRAFTLQTGLLDRAHLASALALVRSGKKDAAIRRFAEIKGFFTTPLTRQWQAEVRTALALPAPVGVDVTADPALAQDFTLDDLSGAKVSLSGLRGKVVLLAFWATWCGPCRDELPVLEKFATDHAQDGVVLMTINVDSFDARASVQPYLDENGYRFPVLFEDPKQLTSYDYRGIPALYVIDREGKIAEARTGYDPNFKEKLQGKVLDIARGKPTPGRRLLRIETAPAGFGLLWRLPLEGDPDALAIAPPLGESAGEVGLFVRNRLLRVDATGREVGAKPVQGWVRALSSGDLDGDRTREWVLGGYRDVKVLDDRGEVYWEHEFNDRTTLLDVREAKAPAMGSIIVREGAAVVALSHIPKERWKTPDFEDVEAMHAVEGGPILVQTEAGVMEIGAEGTVTENPRPAPAGLTLSGRLVRSTGAIEVYEGRYDLSPTLDADVDGDGKDDIVLLGASGVRAYDTDGREILRIDGDENDWRAATGDLDGKPGDELVLAVRHYGLVALGRAATARAGLR